MPGGSKEKIHCVVRQLRYLEENLGIRRERATGAVGKVDKFLEEHKDQASVSSKEPKSSTTKVGADKSDAGDEKKEAEADGEAGAGTDPNTDEDNRPEDTVATDQSVHQRAELVKELTSFITDIQQEEDSYNRWYDKFSGEMGSELTKETKSPADISKWMQEVVALINGSLGKLEHERTGAAPDEDPKKKPTKKADPKARS